MERALAWSLLLVGPACTVQEIDLAMRDCPCAPGWVCDEATDTCVPGGALDAGTRDAGGDAPAVLPDALEPLDATDGSRGADAAAGPPFAPSNDVPSDLLDGVTATLSVPDAVTVNVDTGEILSEGGGTIRGGGTGVVDGIGYHLTASGLAVIAVNALTVDEAGVLRVFGARPVVLLSSGDVRVSGTIDISAGLCPDGSMAAACAGPGGGTGAGGGGVASGCAPGGAGVEDGDTGGGGGGLGTDGAPGGAETDDTMSPGGLGGAVASPPCPVAELEPLAGGSGGGRGGGMAAAAGGGGGGALQLTSFGSLRIDGSIDAGGGGGAAPETNAGAGGGGSGGAVLLEATSIDLDGAVIAANGGGGGEGGAAASGSDGLVSAMPAPGGASGAGRAGGDGGAAGSAPTAGMAHVNDTGGGGGAVGIVHLLGLELAIDGAVISPAPTTGTPRM